MSNFIEIPLWQFEQLQAEEEGLWFDARHITEGYLQQELRRLHEGIEINLKARQNDE